MIFERGLLAGLFILKQDEKVVAFKDINPQSSVHVQVVPREHIENLKSLTPAHVELGTRRYCVWQHCFLHCFCAVEHMHSVGMKVLDSLGHKGQRRYVALMEN